MALQYIVDGYNVVKKSPFLNYKKLKDSRDAFLSFIDKYRPQGSRNNKITVVFDGREDVIGFRHNYDFSVIFTKNESADSFIKSAVDKAQHPKNIVVISDDKDIKFYCRAQGAKILEVKDFIKKGCKKIDGPKTRNSDFSEISSLQRQKINEELSQIWLKQS